MFNPSVWRIYPSVFGRNQSNEGFYQLAEFGGGEYLSAGAMNLSFFIGYQAV
ncbi:hypothetical protein [Salinibacillus aidingensis]|uniref:hypothetical protein n=1 Tax=Salinibacillus aidingensis TaxID=237684 RepID=UPI0031D32E66